MMMRQRQKRRKAKRQQKLLLSNKTRSRRFVAFDAIVDLVVVWPSCWAKMRRRMQMRTTRRQKMW